jgi:hypothetical protein
MQQFIGQATGQLPEHLFGVATVGEQAQGFLQLLITQAFALLTVGLEHIDRRQFAQAHHEIVGADRDHLFRRLSCALTTLEVLGNHFVKIIDAVQVNVVQLADFRLDIPGNGDVDHEDRFVLAQLQRAFHRALAKNRQLTGGRADDDIAAHQFCRDVRQQHRVGAELLGQQTGALQRAVGNDDALDTQLVQMAGDQSNGLAGTDQQGLAALQITENLFGQADRGKRHRHRVFTDRGVGAHLLGRIECRLKQSPQQRADGAGLAGHGVGRFHLTENLRLAQHQRVEPGGDAHHVTNCRIIFMHISTRAQLIEA